MEQNHYDTASGSMPTQIDLEDFIRGMDKKSKPSSHKNQMYLDTLRRVSKPH